VFGAVATLAFTSLQGAPVTPPKGQAPDKLLSSNRAAAPESSHWETSILPDDNLPSQMHDPVLVTSSISLQQNVNLNVWFHRLSVNDR